MISDTCLNFISPYSYVITFKEWCKLPVCEWAIISDTCLNFISPYSYVITFKEWCKLPACEWAIISDTCLNFISPYSYVITFKEWCKLPACEWAITAELSQWHLQEEQRNTNKHQHNNIRYEKSASSISIAQVRESPDISQSNCHPQGWQNKVKSAWPVSSFCVLIFVFFCDFARDVVTIVPVDILLIEI